MLRTGVLAALMPPLHMTRFIGSMLRCSPSSLQRLDTSAKTLREEGTQGLHEDESADAAAADDDDSDDDEAIAFAFLADASPCP